MSFFANMFGYVLNALYVFVGNYGWAIILFTVLVKICMLPISIKQQKTMKISQKINEEMKQLQFKYKNDPEKLNSEVMNLYKREKMSPFSGCFSAIIQIILLLSMFLLVRSPLTYMKKMDPNVINKLQEYVSLNNSNSSNTTNYKEIAIINYMNLLKNYELEEKNKIFNSKEANESNTQVDENNLEQEKSEEDLNQESFSIQDYIDEAYINMNFLRFGFKQNSNRRFNRFYSIYNSITICCFFFYFNKNVNQYSKGEKINW